MSCQLVIVRESNDSHAWYSMQSTRDLMFHHIDKHLACLKWISLLVMSTRLTLESNCFSCTFFRHLSQRVNSNVTFNVFYEQESSATCQLNSEESSVFELQFTSTYCSLNKFRWLCNSNSHYVPELTWALLELVKFCSLDSLSSFRSFCVTWEEKMRKLGSCVCRLKDWLLVYYCVFVCVCLLCMQRLTIIVWKKFEQE